MRHMQVPAVLGTILVPYPDLEHFGFLRKVYHPLNVVLKFKDLV
jgi:hypothetical protein